MKVKPMLTIVEAEALKSHLAAQTGLPGEVNRAAKKLDIALEKYAKAAAAPKRSRPLPMGFGKKPVNPESQ